MIINFLQTRNPPILPALHQRPHLKLPSKDGRETTFADNLDALRDFGKANKETLGELLFHFFRFYGHEMDYDNYVVSVRNGKLISKLEKGWHLATNNRLCVEEPFNINRNLGNTADDFSFRGLHMELRRAFDLIAEANLDTCCDEYVFPKEEERIWEKPPPQPKPVLSRSTSQTRGGRGGFRPGRHSDRNNRNGNNRRASSGAFDNNSIYGQQGSSQGLTPQEAWTQTQAAQERLHNDLYTTFSVLQAQENNLRLQLYAQSQVYAQVTANAYHAQRIQPNGGINKQQATDRSRGSSFDNPPLTAPIRPDMYFFPLQYQPAPIYGQHSPNTYPSSPSMTPALPELRRSLHRSTVTGGSGGGVSSSSLRSHSQPAARSVPSPLVLQGLAASNYNVNGYTSYPVRQTNGIVIPNFIADENIDPSFENDPPGALGESPPDDGTPKEYVGYYLNNGSPPSHPRRESVVPTIPAFGDIGQSRRRLSTDQFPQTIFDRLRRASRSPSPHRAYSTGISSATIPQQNVTSSSLRSFTDHSPLVVNGSSSVSAPKNSGRQPCLSDSSPENAGNDAPPSDMASQAWMLNGNLLSQRDSSTQETHREQHTIVKYDNVLVVNGSGSHVYDFNEPPVSSTLVNGLPHATPVKGPGAEEANGNRTSPPKSNRPGRQLQSGAMSPLDIGPSEALRDDITHLSPVYETRSPSPTANRKFEPKLSNARSQKPITQETTTESKPAFKLALANVSQKQTGLKPPSHTRASKSEGSGPGSWQKIPKSKKKSQAADQKSGVSGSQNLSEQAPKNDSERKGG
jgi:Cid1 family poly A polymerase